MPTKVELEAQLAEAAELIAKLAQAQEQAPAKAPAKKVAKLAPKDGFIPVNADGSKSKGADKPSCWVGRDPRSERVIVAYHHEATRGPRQSKASYVDARTGETKTPANAYSGMKAIPTQAESHVAELLTQ